MIEEQGVVIDIRGNKALVKAEKSPSCENCASREACHITIGTNEVVIEAENSVNAKFGDKVVVTIGSATILKTSLMLYLTPIAGLIIGVILGQIIVKQFAIDLNPDLLSGIFGGIFLIIAFFSIRLYGKLLEKKQGFMPVVARVI